MVLYTYYNSLKNRNQFIDKFPKTFYSVCHNSNNDRMLMRWTTSKSFSKVYNIFTKNILSTFKRLIRSQR